MNPGQITTTEARPLPESIEWMPAGKFRISPKDRKGNAIEVTCEPEDAARLDAQLQTARAESDAGKRSRLFVDFNHESKDAAAIPLRFYWENGIRLSLEWTVAGANAIAGRVYSYFSPEFYPSKDGRPDRIPDVGALGSLVNTPAFQTIERIAAAMDTTTNPETSMKLILSALGLPEDSTEAQAVDAIAALKQAEATTKASLEAVTSDNSTIKANLASTGTERDTIKAERDSAVAEVVTLKAEKAKRTASDFITAAIAEGRITEASRSKFEAMHIENPANCAEVIASLAVRRGEAPIQGAKADSGTADARILAEYRGLKDDARTKFFAEHQDAIWRAYSVS